MKARLIYSDGGIYQLLISNGKILTVSSEDAKKFLLEFDSEAYYSDPGEWDAEGISMADYSGETVAQVDSRGRLVVVNAIRFRSILSGQEVKYLTAAEFGDKHGRNAPIVRRMCADGRIKGAVLKGRVWLIPEDSPYPADARVGSRIERVQ